MYQNEPDTELRTLSATLYATAGGLLPSATSWVAGMVKISKAGGAFSNAANLPTAITGGGDGAFDLELALAEVDTIGTLRVRFFDEDDNLLAEYVDEIIERPTSTVVASGSSSGSSWWISGTILKSDILAVAPGLSTLPDATWVVIVAFLKTFEATSCEGLIKPASRKLALSLLGAHLGTILSSTTSTDAAGAVISESAGGLKRTYAQPTSAEAQSDLGRTKYGLQYLAIISMTPSVRGPFLV